jgi:hypothetical protein
MNFRAELNPASFQQKINYRHPLLLIGSCFTEEIGNKFIKHKFDVFQNPSGILFNPISIATTLIDAVHRVELNEGDLEFHNELWHSWKHHSRFSSPSKEILLEQACKVNQLTHDFIRKAEWIMITLGSAFVYERNSGPGFLPVANCHKVPADKFHRRLMGSEEVYLVLKNAIEEIRGINSKIKCIITISPVRHLREGFIENNRSKAALIQAVHQLADENQIFYFPAFELVMDDLRDYRFYAEDMAHPNYLATQYVWEKFTAAALDQEALNLMKEINMINAARSHKPFHPGSEAHKKFLDVHLEKTKKLLSDFPFLDFSAELAYFGG